MSADDRSGLKYILLTVAIVALVGIAAVVGTRSSRAGSGTAPSAAARTLDVTIGEGTSFAVAASRGGDTIVTDLLGSLWTIPGRGGRATRITDELLEAKQPSVSPDGRQVVFQGFYDGDGWDIWTIGVDGTNPK